MQKKNLSSMSITEISSVHSAPSIPLGIGAQPISCSVEKDNEVKHSQAVECDEEGSHIGAENYNQALGFKTIQESEYPSYNARRNPTLSCETSETWGTQNVLGCKGNGFDCRVDSAISSCDKYNVSSETEVEENNAIPTRSSIHGLHLAENASTSSEQSSKTVVSPFEFHVSSEKGISLIVDLNASPSDWPKGLENEVSNCHCAQNNRFRSLREELEHLGNSREQMNSLSPWKTDTEKPRDNDHVLAESYDLIQRDCDLIVVGHPYRAGWSSRSSSRKPCNDATNMSAGIEEDRELFFLSETNTEVQDHARSGTKFRLSEKNLVPAESNIITTPLVEFSSNGVVNSMTESPKFLDPVEHQYSVLGDEICKELTMNITCGSVKVSQLHPVSSSSGSVEMQSSGVASQQKNAYCSPFRESRCCDVVDPMLNLEAEQDELADSSTCACAEESERIKLSSGAETSEAFHSKMSLKKRPQDSVAVIGLKRKRLSSEVEGIDWSGELNTRILRSRKRLSERVLPRRSMRLVPKV